MAKIYFKKFPDPDDKLDCEYCDLYNDRFCHICKKINFMCVKENIIFKRVPSPEIKSIKDLPKPKHKKK